MAQYIVAKNDARYGTIRYGMFETRTEAQRWADDHIGGDTSRSVRAITDKSEAETPSLKVGDVVRAKDRDHRVGMHFYMPGGSEGVVARTLENYEIVTFHASHPSAPDKDWTSQRVDRRDLIKVDRACSHL